MTKPLRSFQIRHVDAGSCNGCEQELTALTGPDYDIQQYGLDVVASPRHADGLLVTGPIVDTMARPVERVYAAMATPKFRMAFGDCAAGRGLFQACYTSHGGLAHPDVVVPGCPPDPGTAIALIREWLEAEASGPPPERTGRAGAAQAPLWP